MSMNRWLVCALLPLACGPNTVVVPAPNARSVPTPTNSVSPSGPVAPGHQFILDSHNRRRAHHCAPPLQWSDELATVARSWALELQRNGCAFEHNRQTRYGENLSFFAPVGSLSPDEIVAGWYDEHSAYDFAKGDFDFSTGHFSQVVWRATERLGCGQSQCNGGELWVCNYDPPGNLMGAFGKNVLPTSCK